MDWQEFVKNLFELVLFPLMGVLTSFLIAYFKEKKVELQIKSDNDIVDKYLDLADKIITDCVLTTTQTYVEALKKEGKFDAEAQKTAFNMTLNNVLSLLTVEAKEVLSNVVGDLNVYLTTKIESSVNAHK